ncbi:LytTR family DNA-binding domain-containing protein [Butyrivibrio sp. INlla16]|uniref:LytTR family DNA-binding domain-containing protein n=1 Tax=Butyrivibrio sp. INlla16 TaxID=1520807 RepID=UPI00088C9DBB|nr:LytTR family DNA-binding domain-containing protein [Butyrivibrio sp. INlla16]SDB53346.1 LytTr DNA-binding domain-containing protein [Butyrivibrio sp. INlla16]
MQIITRQVKDKPLTVTIEYPERTDFVTSLVRRISSMDTSFSASIDGRRVKIRLADVYYIENVERKLFLYTAKEVYRLDSSMSEMLSITEDTGLVRISRTCIMNTDHLKEIRQVRNSHLEAVLDNDEMLIVSRKYLKDIKRVFQK